MCAEVSPATLSQLTGEHKLMAMVLYQRQVGPCTAELLPVTERCNEAIPRWSCASIELQRCVMALSTKVRSLKSTTQSLVVTLRTVLPVQ